MLIFAQISDSHLGGDPLRQNRLSQTVNALRSCGLPFDAILFSGDVSETGSLEEYESAAEILAQLSPPLILCPGNHDKRQNFAQVFPQLRQSNQTFLNSRHDFLDLTVLALDTLVEGHDFGTLHLNTLCWLEQQLEEIQNPVLICLHHPPCGVGHPLVDETILTNAEDLARLAKIHKRVIGFVAGHTHTAAASTFADRPLALAPGIASTLLLPNEQRRGMLPLTDAGVTPGYAVHLVRKGRLFTHFRTLSHTHE